MSKLAQSINPPTLVKPAGYSHSWETQGGKTVYIAGQVAVDKDGRVVGAGDLVAQFRQVCEKVRGITVRSRNLVVNVGAAIQTMFGGNITLYTELCERARREAFDLMLEHASQVGANAVVAMRYDANDVAAGVTEVLAYGTAVVIEPAAR
jgi:uncharacterized protein YbjQ (UPF0145 family)